MIPFSVRVETTNSTELLSIGMSIGIAIERIGIAIERIGSVSVESHYPRGPRTGVHQPTLPRTNTVP